MVFSPCNTPTLWPAANKRDDKDTYCMQTTPKQPTYRLCFPRVTARQMCRVLEVDVANGTAHIQAGVVGRKMAEELAERGVTMGHEPDSLEFSTLGGWVATRASGMKRGR